MDRVDLVDRNTPPLQVERRVEKWPERARADLTDPDVDPTEQPHGLGGDGRHRLGIGRVGRGRDHLVVADPELTTAWHRAHRYGARPERRSPRAP
ncbi:hypothetical protein MKK64_23660 [Methylobacterium sp. E-025]|uniref:hypothetical protein n=1 Tax=Methylobacterium sp. E-025 TaxID=2836561 RepID=UPI001FB96FAA|nr:hypothetical protein [Methylobacterium sp. E-025]MCJ2114169.1 hypothetical protein [Methylobacterium sp. E-025]